MKNYKISLFCSLLLVFLVSVIMIFGELSSQKKDADTFKELKEIGNEFISDEPIEPRNEVNTFLETEENKKCRHIEIYRNQNSECIGWIFIDGTNVDYPVMHSPNSPQKYLKTNFYGSYSQSGVPFLDSRCNLVNTNLIIYGHNMKNGTMFSDLKKYLKADFKNTHKTIKFETVEGIKNYTVTDVIRTDINDGLYKNILSEERLLILSTCYGSSKSGRLLIIAKEA